MRSDHCWSHGRGQPEGLVPRRELQRPGPGLLRQRDAERLEDDALHVVLGLGLGEPEAVDLHAVAEAQRLLVGDAVALAADALPQVDERPHLAGLLDEADAGVDEEADRGEHGGEAVGLDLAGLLHGVEHADGGGEGVGDLLHRRRPGLLQVVASRRSSGSRAATRSVQNATMSTISRRLGSGGKMYVPRLRYSLTMSFWVVPRSSLAGDAVVLGVGDVEAEQPRRGGVDRHRGVHLVDGDAVEQLLHVTEVGHRARRPCRPRPWPSGRRGRSRSGWAGRRRSTGRSAPWPGWCGRARWTRVAVEWPL